LTARGHTNTVLAADNEAGALHGRHDNETMGFSEKVAWDALIGTRHDLFEYSFGLANPFDRIVVLGPGQTSK
jgi:hypothetical protein